MLIRNRLPARAAHRHGYPGPARVTWLAAAVLAAGCASVLDEDGALTVVPYRVSSTGQIVVDATVNDTGPFEFAFDTGASISVVFDGLRKRIGLDSKTDRRVLIQGMVGSGSFPIVVVDRLQLGSEAWTNVRFAAMPGSTSVSAEVDGILGVDLLDRYAVSFSGEDKALRLFAPASVRRRSYKGWAAVPLRALQIGEDGPAVYAIDIRIGPVEIPALLDLGASSNLMNWRAARALGVRPLSPSRAGEISGAVETTLVAAQLEVESLQTGDLRWSRNSFLIADFPIFGVLGLDDRPVAIIGAELFNRRDFVIDFARKRLLVKSIE